LGGGWVGVQKWMGQGERGGLGGGGGGWSGSAGHVAGVVRGTRWGGGWGGGVWWLRVSGGKNSTIEPRKLHPSRTEIFVGVSNKN